jgi:ketosteroid isomerase-like protein
MTLTSSARNVTTVRSPLARASAPWTQKKRLVLIEKSSRQAAILSPTEWGAPSFWSLHGPQSVPLYAPCQGREAVTKWLEFIVREFAIAEFVTDTFVAERDHVVVLGRESGTARQTGRAYATQFAHVFRDSDGQIVSYDGFEDSSAMVAALGG